MCWFARSLVLVGLFFATASCSDSQTTISCDAVCDRYRECFDDEYDVEECTLACEDGADRDPEFDADVAACHECIQGRSCAGSTFACATECLGIVP
jgi:hypothetical protein